MECSLCHLPLPKRPLVSEGLFFCCHGCCGVYQVLASQGALQGARSHPLFQKAVEAGLISNPRLLEELEKKAESQELERSRLSFEIEGMWCPSCAEIIRLILLRERGVFKVLIDYATDLASLEFYPRITSKKRLFELIEALGYRPKRLGSPSDGRRLKRLRLRLAVALFCTLNVMMFSYPVYAGYFHASDEFLEALFARLALIASLPVLAYSAWPIWKRGWQALRVGWAGMELLIALGVFSAFGLSLYELARGRGAIYFDSMCMVIALTLLGNQIERRAKFSTKEAMACLTRSLPRRARRLFPDGSAREVPLKEVKAGDLLLAHSGEQIVLDGQLVRGGGLVDESVVTGESVPVFKEEGSPLVAGSILKQGSFSYRATKTAAASTLALMLSCLEEQLGRKKLLPSPLEKLLRWFVPAAAALAALLWIGFGRPLDAISALLIACPCAIGVAIPLAESHWIQRMAKEGAIVRNRAALYALPHLTAFIFDKTGTVTEGNFSVLKGIEGLKEEERAILKGLSACSNHPVAAAVHRSLSSLALPLERLEEVVGKGMRGEVGGLSYSLGSKSFLESCGVKIEAEGPSLSTAYYGCEGRLLAEISLGDRLREGAAEAVQSLSPALRILLSGDRKRVVERVAAFCGFDRCYAEKSPLEKRALVEEFTERGERVCLIGDGINDAPALAAADVSISTASAADISIYTSDLLLTTNRLDSIPKLLALSKKACRIARQNLFWAFFYNVIGVGLAAFGLLSPLYAASAMLLSSLLVTANSFRLRGPV